MKYDRDYYEAGLETRKSCYQNYRWMPEATMSMAMRLIDHFNLRKGATVLDFGCAKGFLVKAFRLLHRNAFGIDLSEYALSCVPDDVKQFCSFNMPLTTYFDLILAKDVFEHIEKETLVEILQELRLCNLLFAVIPLGDGERYFSPLNNLDPTHVLCYTDTEWLDFFEEQGWQIIDRSFRFPGMKENHPRRSHGFFTIRPTC